jgi:hypothetical protein
MLGLVFGIAIISFVIGIPYKTFKARKEGDDIGWGAYLFSLLITFGFLAIGIAWIIGTLKS